MTKEKPMKASTTDKIPAYQGYVINEKGEEIPITEEMMAESLRKVKLKSIGAHTGHTKAITPELIAEHAAE